MTGVRSVLRHAFYRSGARHAYLAAHRTALRARSGRVRNAAGVVLHVDAADERGVLLAAKRGRLDRGAVACWRRLAAELRPTVAIDVGANYGEVAFSTRYPGLRELHLVEPNPAVLRWLRQTVAGAAAAYPRVVLHAGAASDADRSASLNLHAHSGTASLLLGSDRRVDVACFRLDERIRLDAGDTVLFKVDVEGHERSAIEGMAGLLDGRRVAGVCEVMHADDELVDFLCDRFAVAMLRRGAEVPVDAAQLRDELARARAYGWRDLGKDVVVRSRSGS